MFQGMLTHTVGGDLSFYRVMSNMVENRDTIFQDAHLLCDFPTPSTVRFANKGKLGSNVCQWDIDTPEPNFSNAAIRDLGSMHFKFTGTGYKLSIIVFPARGSVKISGSFPDYEIFEAVAERDECTVSQAVDKYFDDIRNMVSVRVFGNTCTTFKISCINGGFASDKRIPSTDRFSVHVAEAFGRTWYEPELGGRRFAVRMYPDPARNFHIAVDHKGKVQIFSAHNLDEMLELKKQYLRVLDTYSGNIVDI